MPLTSKESNLHAVTLIPKTKQNQCRIAEGSNNMKYGYDNSKAPHPSTPKLNSGGISTHAPTQQMLRPEVCQPSSS